MKSLDPLRAKKIFIRKKLGHTAVLHRSIGHGLKTCMWFGYNPQIRFCFFFRNLNLVFFSGIITINICRQYVPCDGNSSYEVYIFR